MRTLARPFSAAVRLTVIATSFAVIEFDTAGKRLTAALTLRKGEFHRLS